jgi:hypothetical protein
MFPGLAGLYGWSAFFYTINCEVMIMKNFFKRFSVLLCLCSLLFCGFGGLESVSADSDVLVFSKLSCPPYYGFDYITSSDSGDTWKLGLALTYSDNESPVVGLGARSFSTISGSSSDVTYLFGGYIYLASYSPFNAYRYYADGSTVKLSYPNYVHDTSTGLYYAFMGWTSTVDLNNPFISYFNCPYVDYTVSQGGDSERNSFMLPYLVNVLAGDYTGISGVDDPSTSDFDSAGDVGTLDLPSLGYLQNVKFTTLQVNDRSNVSAGDSAYDSVINSFKYIYRVKWDSTTTTGMSFVDTDNFCVQYTLQALLYDSSGNLVTSGNTDYFLNTDSDLGGDYYDNNATNVYISMTDGVVEDLRDSILSKAGLTDKEFSKYDYSWKYRVHLRPYLYSREGFFGGCFYGGWTVVKITSAEFGGTNEYTVDTGTNDDSPTINDDGELDNVVDSVDKDSTGGTGSTPDVADDTSNIDSSDNSFGIGDIDISTDDVSSITTSAKNFLSVIGNVPSIIKSLFSFLPDWCLSLVATGFALLVILIVYKLIRG